MAMNQNQMRAAGALGRALGKGSDGTNFAAYKDENGKVTTYRPEFAGQTVQIGTQYVSYDERGYPTKSLNAKHAANLGNDYTMQNMGLDQTKIANAADIYRGIYNSTMGSGASAQGALANAFGKQNIQYDSSLSAEDYTGLMQQAADRGQNVLAGYLEDSRNALLHSSGRDSEQTSSFNSGWNWVDNGGGVGNIYASALKDPQQSGQALGGGWYLGQGKGDAKQEYFYSNTDAPTMQEVLSYAGNKGYDTESESLPVGALAREMMNAGYLSPKTLQQAEALKAAMPSVLNNLGIVSGGSGTEALDRTIGNIRSGGSPYVQAMQQMSGGIPAAYGGSTEKQLLGLYDNGGGYAAALQQLKNLTDAQTAQAVSGYTSRMGAVNSSYADMFRQLYIDREKSKKDLNQQLAAYGVTGGGAESTMLGLDTAYQEALRQGEQSRIGELNALAQAAVQAQLDGDIAYARQALQLEQKRMDDYADLLQTVMNRQDKQLTEKAELLAGIGDFSGYKALGYTEEEIAALEQAYAAAHRPKTSSSGGGSSKPKLTLSQAEKLLKEGVVTDKTLYAYEYYTGQPWVREEEDSGNLSAKSNLVFTTLVDALMNRDRKAAQQHLDEVWDGLTDVQKNEVHKLLRQYGYRYQP